MPKLHTNGIDLYYEITGAGEPLVLIAGLGYSSLMWHKMVPGLTQHFQVITFDNRGVGETDKPAGPYTAQMLADDTAGLLTALGISRAAILGHSMGGFIAQHLTLRHPPLVRKLVLVSTSAGGATHVKPAPEIAALLIRDPNEAIETRVRRARSMVTGPGFAETHPEDIARAIEHAFRFPMSPEAYLRQLGAVETHFNRGTRARLSEIRVPTLVIHGDCDPLVPYPNGQVLAAEIPGAKFLTLPGVGHLPHVEAAEQFNRAVMEFLG